MSIHLLWKHYRGVCSHGNAHTQVYAKKLVLLKLHTLELQSNKNVYKCFTHDRLFCLVLPIKVYFCQALFVMKPQKCLQNLRWSFIHINIVMLVAYIQNVGNNVYVYIRIHVIVSTPMNRIIYYCITAVSLCHVITISKLTILSWFLWLTHNENKDLLKGRGHGKIYSEFIV